MTEQLHFSELWPHWPELLAGLWVTVQLTVLATIGGLAIGILGAAIRSGRPGMLSRVWGGYVDPAPARRCRQSNRGSARQQ
ncbi:hypothetical protein ACLBSN_30875, partial [Klebsiella pneumoniae]